jgi:hypothetical protein
MPESFGGMGIVSLRRLQSASILALHKKMTLLNGFVRNFSLFIRRCIRDLELSRDPNPSQFEPSQMHNEEVIAGMRFIKIFGTAKVYHMLRDSISIDEYKFLQKGTSVALNLWNYAEGRNYDLFFTSLSEFSFLQGYRLNLNESALSCAFLHTLPSSPTLQMLDDDFNSAILHRLLLRLNDFTMHGMINSTTVKDKSICPLCSEIFGENHATHCPKVPSDRSSLKETIKHFLRDLLCEAPGSSAVLQSRVVHPCASVTLVSKDEARNVEHSTDLMVKIQEVDKNVSHFERDRLNRSTREKDNSFSFGIGIGLIDEYKESFAAYPEYAPNAVAAEELNIARTCNARKEKHQLITLPFVISSNGNIGEIGKDIIRMVEEVGEKAGHRVDVETFHAKLGIALSKFRQATQKRFFDALEARLGKTNFSPPKTINGDFTKPKNSYRHWFHSLKNTSNFPHDSSSSSSSSLCHLPFIERDKQSKVSPVERSIHKRRKICDPSEADELSEESDGSELSICEESDLDDSDYEEDSSAPFLACWKKTEPIVSNNYKIQWQRTLPLEYSPTSEAHKKAMHGKIHGALPVIRFKEVKERDEVEEYDEGGREVAEHLNHDSLKFEGSKGALVDSAKEINVTQIVAEVGSEGGAALSGEDDNEQDGMSEREK